VAKRIVGQKIAKKMLYLGNRITWSLDIKSLDDETQKLDPHISVHGYRKCLELVRSLRQIP